jgi:hypothetical protein
MLTASYVAVFLLARLVGPATQREPFTPQEVVEIQAAALRDTFDVDSSPRFQVPSTVFLGVGRHRDPSPELLARVAHLPFAVRRRSECSKRKTVLGEVCILAGGEAEVWLGAVTRLGDHEAELWVGVGEVSCPRRLRRDAGVWRMLTAKEYPGVCRIA